MNTKKEKNLKQIEDLIKNGADALIDIDFGEFYIVRNWWRADASGAKFDVFDKRFGTKTTPRFSVFLHPFECDADTLLIKVANGALNAKKR